MRKTFALALVAALAPQAVAAKIVRHNEMPQAYRGTWAPAAASCTDGDKSAIVLAAKTYAGPAGNCAIEYVTETAAPNGTIYSARMQCSAAAAPAAKKSIANLIIRADNGGQVSLGATFAKLAPYQRCPAAGQDEKK